MVSVYVPAANPLVLVVTVTLDGAVPEPPDKLNHGCVLLAVQSSVPPPMFVMLMVWDAGLPPSTVPKKVRAAGVTLKVGNGEDTFNVTLTSWGDPVALARLTVSV